MIQLPDIYFFPEHGKLYEDLEKGKTEQFIFKNELGTIYNQFIKRSIDITIDGKQYYDIVTPYGYGGPIIIECEAGNRLDLVKTYASVFEKYCKDNNIISEFIRFHPILNNQADFKGLYNIKFLRRTIAVNLQDYGDPFKGEFKKGARKKVNNAINMGMIINYDFEGKTIDNFYKIYESTMDRNQASNYYYFGLDFFKNTFKVFKDNVFIVNIVFEEHIVASGVYIYYEGLIHALFSGTLNEYLQYSPAYLLFSAVTTWGYENGLRYFHLGGGFTNSEEDGLYLFKKRFSKNTSFKYHIGCNIWNFDIYNKLVDEAKKNKTNICDDFFPVYRGGRNILK